MLSSIERKAIDSTRAWLESMVIGLNLCPFARPVSIANRLRFHFSTASTDQERISEVMQEAENLATCRDPRAETTLLVYDRGGPLADFLDYLDFTVRCDKALKEQGYSGTVQIATFHPHYRFADSEEDALENYTNRSPYPIVHLLLEDSITRVAPSKEAQEKLLEIPARNMQTLRAMGRQAVLERLRVCESDVD